jgi:hypothetical protein
MSTLVVNHPEIEWPLDYVAYLLLPRDLDTWLNDSIEVDEILEYIHGEHWDWAIKLPEWFVEKYPYTRQLYQQNIGLSQWFIKEYVSYEDQQTIAQKRDLTLDIVKRYCHLFGEKQWRNISGDNVLDAEFIESHIGKLYFPYLCTNDSFTMPLVEKYIDKCDWLRLAHNENLTPEFIDAHWNKFDEVIEYNRGFTMDLIKKYDNKLNWIMLHQNQNLTRNFIHSNWNKFNEAILKHPSVDEALIREHLDADMGWVFVLQNPNVTLAFIEEHIDYFPLSKYVPPSVVWSNRDLLQIIFSPTNVTSGADYKAIIATCRLWHNTIASPERAHQYMNVISTLIMRHPEKRWEFRVLSQHITMDIVVPYLDVDASRHNIANFRKNHNYVESRLNYKLLVQNPRLTYDIIHKYDFLLYYKRIKYLTGLTTRIIRNCLTIDECDQIIDVGGWTQDMLYSHVGDFDEYGCWELISAHVVGDDFITDYEYVLEWYDLSKNANLTMSLIERFIDKVVWQSLVDNPNLTHEFIRDNIHEWKNVERIQQHPQFGLKELGLRSESFWAWIVCNHNLPLEFITTNLSKLSLFNLSSNVNLTPAIIREHIDKWDWYRLALNRAVTIDILEENIHRLNELLYDVK